MTTAKFDVTMLAGEEGDAIASIAIDRNEAFAYVMPDGRADLYTTGALLTTTDLRRLADTIDAIQAGTYQGTPTYAEICDTARELRQVRP